jgi:tetratricopeptide (TPR) repeat protein
MLSNKPLMISSNSSANGAVDLLANNPQAWAELLTFVDFAENLTIGFAEVNAGADADVIVEALLAHPHHEAIQFVVFDFSQQDDLRFLRDELIRQLATVPQEEGKKRVLIVRGLEKAIGVFGDAPPMLQDLNFIRDAYRTSIPHPLLLILPDYAVTRLAKFAPDFWAWRSGVFRFKSLERARDEAFQVCMNQEIDERYFVKPEDQQERIDLLHRLLMDYAPSGQAVLPEHFSACLTLYQQLGDVYRRQREFDQAIKAYGYAIEFAEKLKSSRQKAKTLSYLGAVYFNQRNWQKAEDLYQDCLALERQIEDRSSQAHIYYRLGRVAQEMRQFEVAERYYQQALEIFSEFSDRYNQASTYHSLGNVAYLTQQYEAAEHNFQQALEIQIEFSDRYNQASTYQNLGIVAQDTRQYETAEQYYQQALEIKIEFGDRYFQASTYGQLGLLAEELGNIPEARTYLQQAMTIFVEFGDEHSMAITQESCDRLSEREAEREKGD